jgi:uncharacterized protein (DUF58 family)
MDIFDSTILARLERLALAADQVRVGVMKGDRRSRKRGSSVEFADYRNYSQGDDLRRLDWNVYARLERPFIKLFEEEEDLAVHILLDASASMNWPPEQEESNKLRYGLYFAAALGYIGLASGDLLSVTLLQQPAGDNPQWGPFRGRQHSLSLFQFLDAFGRQAISREATEAGATDLNRSLRQHALRARRPGLLLLISDLLSPGGHIEGLSAIQGRGYEVSVIHLLSPDEVEPSLVGDLTLLDVETGETAELTLDAPALNAYRERLTDWQAAIAEECNRRQIVYVPVITTTPWDVLVLQTLRQKGVVG